jgi:preprotein translocase subunit SecA
MKNFINNIKSQSNQFLQKTDEELDVLVEKTKRRVEKEGLDSIVVDWFALVQEVSFRKIGLRHFDTQLLAGLLLHQGKIVEMKTGEGKTLASTLPVSLNALTKKGVHVVTVNEYLAERDQKLMGKIYKGLGLTVGLNKSTYNTLQKRKSYNADITYVTNSEVVFDFLRDSSAYNLKDVVQRPFHYCVIDEIDSIAPNRDKTNGEVERRVVA